MNACLFDKRGYKRKLGFSSNSESAELLLTHVLIRRKRLKEELKMKTGFLILAMVAATFAETKPGNCPAGIQDVNTTSVITVNTEQTCATDFDCVGTEKCCGQTCAPPECDADVVPAQCLDNPCELATCWNVPEAVCFQDPCSDVCDVVWLTADSDVTFDCLNDDDDDDDDDDEDKKLPWQDRKARRKLKKQGFLKKIADKTAKKVQALEDRRAAKIQKWEKKGKQEKIDRFQQKWEKIDSAIGDRLEDLKAKKLAKKQEKKQGRRDRKQMMREMSPEELEAFKAEIKAKKQEKKEAKLERKEERKEKKEAKLERKEERKENKDAKMERKEERKGKKEEWKEKKNAFIKEKMERIRARKDRKENRKMMLETQ